MSTDFVVAAVGGQPLDRIVELVASACQAAGAPFASTAPRGVLELGGSRLAQLSVGECWSSITTEDSAFLLIGLEAGEALRYAKYVARDGFAIVDTLLLPPRPGNYVTIGAVEAALRPHIKTVALADFRALASGAGGSGEEAHAALLGAASVLPALASLRESWNEGLKLAGASERERKAYEAGAAWGKEKLASS